MAQFKLYNAVVRPGGTRDLAVYKTALTANDIVVLDALHRDVEEINPVVEITETGTVKETTSADEYERLKYSFNPAVVAELFGAEQVARNRMLKELDEESYDITPFVAPEIEGLEGVVGEDEVHIDGLEGLEGEKE